MGTCARPTTRPRPDDDTDTPGVDIHQTLLHRRLYLMVSLGIGVLEVLGVEPTVDHPYPWVVVRGRRGGRHEQEQTRRRRHRQPVERIIRLVVTQRRSQETPHSRPLLQPPCVA